MKHLSVFTCSLLVLLLTTSIQGEEPGSLSSITQELRDLKNQIKENNRKIKILEARLNEKESMKSQQPKDIVRPIRSQQPAATPQSSPYKWPERYLHIPNTNSAIQFIVNPNLAVAYDIDSFSADFIFPPFLPLKGVTPDLKKSRFTMQARGTQFGFRTLSMTNIGELKTELSLDFWGDPSLVIPSTPAYQPRVRYAYVDVAGFTVGQTSSNFLDLDAIGETVDYGSALGLSFRHGLIKYTSHFNKKTSLGIAIERPATDYTDREGRILNYTSPLSASAPSLPDLTAHLKYADKFGHIALRGVARQLKIKDDSLAQPFETKKFGWGLGVSGKLFVYNKSNVFAQFNFGRGIGRYIVILNGQAALYHSITRILDPQRATNTLIGYEHFWNEFFRSNIIYAYSQVSVSKYNPVLTGTTRVTKSIDQFYLNLIYSPIQPLDVGIEFENATRKSVDNYKGKGNRITLGITYKF